MEFNLEFSHAEIRAILKFYFVQGETAREARRKINAVLGDGAVSIRTTEEWFRRFRIGRNDTSDPVPSGRPISTDVSKIIEKIQEDPHVSIKTIAKDLQLSTGTVHRHLKAAGYTKRQDVWVKEELSD